MIPQMQQTVPNKAVISVPLRSSVIKSRISDAQTWSINGTMALTSGPEVPSSRMFFVLDIPKSLARSAFRNTRSVQSAIRKEEVRSQCTTHLGPHPEREKKFCVPSLGPHLYLERVVDDLLVLFIYYLLVAYSGFLCGFH